MIFLLFLFSGCSKLAELFDNNNNNDNINDSNNNTDDSLYQFDFSDEIRKENLVINFKIPKPNNWQVSKKDNYYQFMSLQNSYDDIFIENIIFHSRELTPSEIAQAEQDFGNRHNEDLLVSFFEDLQDVELQSLEFSTVFNYLAEDVVIEITQDGYRLVQRYVYTIIDNRLFCFILTSLADTYFIYKDHLEYMKDNTEIILKKSCSVEIGNEFTIDLASLFPRMKEDLDWSWEIASGSVGTLPSLQYESGYINKIQIDAVANILASTTVYNNGRKILSYVTDINAMAKELWKLDFSDARIMDIAKDINNDIYLVGKAGGGFQGQAGYGRDDGFILKMGPDGNVLWSKLIGGSSFDAVLGIVIDSNNDIIITGYISRLYMDETFFYDRNFIYAKYDPNGNNIWTKIITPLTYSSDLSSVESSDAQGEDITLNQDGNIVIIGRTEGRLDGSALSQGATELFVFKCNQDGDLISYTQQGILGMNFSINVSPLSCISLDQNNNIYMVADSYIYKFNENGSFVWSSEEYSNKTLSSIVTDTNGDMLVAGSCARGMYLLKIDTDGNHIFELDYSAGQGTARAYGVNIDGNNPNRYILSGADVAGLPLLILHSDGRIISRKNSSEYEHYDGKKVLVDNESNVYIIDDVNPTLGTSIFKFKL
ncbi:hypothetical protein ACFLZV_06215 [Candidatus Margulisiibacteriota bacterium]